LLVLECQEQKLTGQALNFGSRTVAFLKALFPAKRIVLVPTFSRSELGPSLADASAEYGRFRSVLIVGHSNAMGLQLTNDHYWAWEVAKPFRADSRSPVDLWVTDSVLRRPVDPSCGADCAGP
jgi:hypothetical protein